MSTYIDAQGAATLDLLARTNQVLNLVLEIFDDNGDPVSFADVTAAEYVVRKTNNAGAVLLSLSLDNGISITSNVITITAENPTYDGFSGGAVHSLSLTRESGTATIVDGIFNIQSYNPVANV